MSAQIQTVAAFTLYLSFILLTGVHFMRQNKSNKDFFLAERQTGPWLTALSAEASDMSGWLMMGLPGIAYLGRVEEAAWTAAGLAIGTYLNWLIIAKPLRKCTEAFGNSITIPEFLSKRFYDSSFAISCVSVLLISFFFVIYTASGFVAAAKLLSAVFHLRYKTALALGALIILSYTILGGYLAVCTNDFVQGSLMFIALLITLILIIISIGGLTQENLEKIRLSIISGENLPQKTAIKKFASVKAALSSLAWGLGYFGMPHILVRFMGCRSSKEITIARRIAITWVLVAFASVIASGILARAYLTSPLAKNMEETVLSAIFQQLYPPFISGIFLCAILASSMSTADSQLLVASSAFSQDFYKAFLRKNASSKEVLFVSRLSVFAVSFISFFIALNPESSIFSLVSYAWALFGSSFGPVILLSLFWKRMTKRGALSGLVGGTFFAIFFHHAKSLFGIYELLPAFIASLALCFIFSISDKNKNPEMMRAFDEYRKMRD